VVTFRTRSMPNRPVLVTASDKMPPTPWTWRARRRTHLPAPDGTGPIDSDARRGESQSGSGHVHLKQSIGRVRKAETLLVGTAATVMVRVQEVGYRIVISTPVHNTIQGFESLTSMQHLDPATNPSSATLIWRQWNTILAKLQAF
jgi:hypothetical protein